MAPAPSIIALRMPLWLSDHFDAGAWLGDDEMSLASVGRLAVGPVGLARRLALELGVAPPASRARRAAQLARRLRETTGFWSRSASVAAVDTALALVELGDALILGGWDGRSGVGRLTELAVVLDGIDPGAAETLRRAEAASASRALRWAEAVIDVDHLAPRLRRLIDVMKDRGLRVRPLASPSPCSASVQLAEPGSLLEAADAGADWLASRPGAVVIGAERSLDVALERLGLPTLGSHASVAASAVVRAFADHAAEQTPRSALDCLRVAPNPIPEPLRGSLLDALSNWPSLRAPSWTEALEIGLAALDDGQRARVRDLLGSNRRASQRALMAWAESAGSDARGMLDVCQELDELREASGETWADAREDARLAELAGDVSSELFDHFAGYHAVGTAGAVVGPCSRLLVWRPVEAPRRRSIWSADERSYLGGAGIVPWVPKDVLARAITWARDEVLVISPRVDDEGRDAATHPLVAQLRAARQTAPSGPFSQVGVAAPSRALPTARTDWTFPRGLPPRDQESPLSVGIMLGCSFRHAVRYGLRIAPTGSSLADGPLLYGRLAHDALHHAHAADPSGPIDELARRASDWFEREGPRLAPALFVSSRAHDRDAVGHAIRRAAEIVAGVCADLHVRIVASEQAFESRAVLAADDGGVVLEGRPDLVLGPSPLIVIDFKWSLGLHRDLLRVGVAHQLALYSALVREHLTDDDEFGEPPVVGYLALRQGLLVVDREIGTPRVQVVAAPPISFTIDALRSSTKSARKQLDVGLLHAPGADLSAELVVSLSRDEIVLAPPCGFCSYGVLCGRALGTPPSNGGAT